MFTKSKGLNTLAVTFTAAGLLLFAYQQFQGYTTDTKLNQEKLALNRLRGDIIYLDEALTMSSRLYVLTGDPDWVQRYKKLESEYINAFSKIDKLLPETFKEKKALESTSYKLFILEDKSFKLVKSGNLAEAKMLLFGKEYRRLQNTYSNEMAKFTAELDKAFNELMASHHRSAIKDAVVLSIIVLFLLFGWFMFLRISKKWYQEKDSMNEKRIADALATEKTVQRANSKLKLLHAHIQDVREKERVAIAYEISEELGQQLAAVKIKLDVINESLCKLNLAEANDLKETSVQLTEALNFSGSLATEVYPSMLKDVGLIQALEWESKKFAEESKANLIFSSEIEDLELNQTTANRLFRIYQEKLKILGRKMATEIMVTLRIEEGMIVISINDDTEEDHENEYTSLEDFDIEEQLFSIGGNIQTHRSAGEGTNYFISIPLSPNESETNQPLTLQQTLS